MAKATTVNIATNREDVMGGLTRVEPQMTPMFSMLKKGKVPKASYTEWCVDDLSDPSLAVVEEGTDFADFENPGENRARIGNHVQRQERKWNVSDLESLVDDAAVANQVAEAKAKKLIEHRRDMASAIGSDQANQAGGGGSGAAKLRGLGQWIYASAQTNNPVPAAYRTPSASINTTASASFAESDVNGVLESIFQQTGDLGNYKLFCGTSLKKEFSDLPRASSGLGSYRLNEDVGANKMTKNILVYEGDFGILEIVPDLFLARDSSTTIQGMRGYVINPDLVEVAFADGPTHYDLEDQGGGPRGAYKSWFTLRVKNPLGLGKFAATS